MTTMNCPPRLVRAEVCEMLSVLNQPMRVLTEGCFNNGGYTLVELDVQPGESVPLHRHSREDEAAYVLAGMFHVEIEASRPTSARAITRTFRAVRCMHSSASAMRRGDC